jgi:hypothetical protein
MVGKEAALRRWLGLGLAGLLVGAAIAVPAPPEPDEVVFPPVTAPPAEAAPRDSVWFCGYGQADGETDGISALATLGSVTATMTFPSAFVGEEASVAERQLEGPIGAAVAVGDIVRRGQAPGFVEFDGGPATATSIVIGAAGLGGDPCVASSSKVWHLAGGTTREGNTLTLRLFNPFPEDAKVSVAGESDFGVVPLPEFTSYDVPGRSWRNLDLETVVPFLDDLAVTITTEAGSVFPTFIQSNGADQATWPGTALSTTWEFPVTGFEGLAGGVVIANPGELPVDVAIDAFTAAGPVEAAATVRVDPGTPVRVRLADFVAEVAGIRVRAGGPVTAVVVAEGLPPAPEEGEIDAPVAGAGPLAGTVGAADPAGRWLLAGAGSVPGAETSIWLLNTSAEEVTVTVRALDAAGLSDKVTLLPGTVRRYPVADLIGGGTVGGFLVESVLPVSAAWSSTSPSGVMFASGIAVGG